MVISSLLQALPPAWTHKSLSVPLKLDMAHRFYPQCSKVIYYLSGTLERAVSEYDVRVNARLWFCILAKRWSDRTSVC